MASTSAVTSSPVETHNQATLETTAEITAATQNGISSTETTISSAEAPAESAGFCDRVSAFFKGISDSIYQFALSVINSIKSLFVKADETSAPENTTETTTTTTETTTTETTQTTTTETEEVAEPTREQQLTDGIAKLRALEALIAGGATLEAVRENFRTELGVNEQNSIRRKMHTLSAPADAEHPQAGERISNDPNFSSRVILGQVRRATETEDRADIQHHVNLVADGSLFRQAIEQVIVQMNEELAALPVTNALNALQEVIDSEAPEVAAVRQAFQAIPDAAVQSAIRRRMWDLAAPEAGNPQPHDRRSASHWANRVIMNEVQWDTEAQPRADIQHHADNLLADGSIFRQAVAAIIAERA